MKGALHLLPRPQQLAFGAGALAIGRSPEIAVHGPRDAIVGRAQARIAAALRPKGGVETKAEPVRVELRIDPELALPDEGFTLEIAPGRIELVARDSRGLNWGASALVQIAAQRQPNLPCLRIRDWPDFRDRGYLLDVSRDRVPTLTTLTQLVDLLELLRVNQLQLYTEHTFAYRAHRLVWQNASPLTHEEIRQIDRWCGERGIELVPNQNSLGHMARWLKHAPYGELAETQPPGETLAPTPEAIDFVRSLYAELTPCFSSAQLNIGCDEPFELGRGRSAAACSKRGKDRVYLEYVLELVRGLHAQGKTVQFWGDIIGKHPKLIPELPREKLVALAWGYEAPLDPAEVPAAIRQRMESNDVDVESWRGFDVQALRYAAAGVPFYVCPGTSAWLSLIGRVPNALANLADAASAGRAHGAAGMLVTDWGDLGHLQPPSVSLPGLCYGASLAWAQDAQAELALFPAIDALIVRDPSGTVGAALARLGRLYAETGLRSLNTSPLALALLRPLGKFESSWGETSRPRLEAIVAEIDAVRADLRQAKPAGFGGAIVARELAQAAALARHGTYRLMHSLLHEGPPKQRLKADLAPLIAEQRACWLARSREGGLADSLARLESALAEY